MHRFGAGGFAHQPQRRWRRPLASNVNHASAGMVVANNAVTKLSDTGTVCIFTLTETDIVLDVAGYLN